MKWLMILASILVLSSCAHGGKWGKMDSNGDGQVTKAEFDAHKDAKFKKYDKNSDGVVDAAEMPKKKCKKKKCKGKKYKKCGDKKECGMKKCKKDMSCCKSGQCELRKGKKGKTKAHKASTCTDGQCQLHSKDKNN